MINDTTIIIQQNIERCRAIEARLSKFYDQFQTPHSNIYKKREFQVPFFNIRWAEVTACELYELTPTEQTLNSFYKFADFAETFIEYSISVCNKAPKNIEGGVDYNDFSEQDKNLFKKLYTLFKDIRYPHDDTIHENNDRCVKLIDVNPILLTLREEMKTAILNKQNDNLIDAINNDMGSALEASHSTNTTITQNHKDNTESTSKKEDKQNEIGKVNNLEPPQENTNIVESNLRATLNPDKAERFAKISKIKDSNYSTMKETSGKTKKDTTNKNQDKFYQIHKQFLDFEHHFPEIYQTIEFKNSFDKMRWTFISASALYEFNKTDVNSEIFNNYANFTETFLQYITLLCEKAPQNPEGLIDYKDFSEKDKNIITGLDVMLKDITYMNHNSTLIPSINKNPDMLKFFNIMKTAILNKQNDNLIDAINNDMGSALEASHSTNTTITQNHKDNTESTSKKEDKQNEIGKVNNLEPPQENTNIVESNLRATLNPDKAERFAKISKIKDSNYSTMKETSGKTKKNIDTQNKKIFWNIYHKFFEFEYRFPEIYKTIEFKNSFDKMRWTIAGAFSLYLSNETDVNSEIFNNYANFTETFLQYITLLCEKAPQNPEGLIDYKDFSEKDKNIITKLGIMLQDVKSWTNTNNHSTLIQLINNNSDMLKFVKTMQTAIENPNNDSMFYEDKVEVIERADQERYSVINEYHDIVPSIRVTQNQVVNTNEESISDDDDEIQNNHYIDSFLEDCKNKNEQFITFRSFLLGRCENTTEAFKDSFDKMLWAFVGTQSLYLTNQTLSNAQILQDFANFAQTFAEYSLYIYNKAPKNTQEKINYNSLNEQEKDIFSKVGVLLRNFAPFKDDITYQKNARNILKCYNDPSFLQHLRELTNKMNMLMQSAQLDDTSNIGTGQASYDINDTYSLLDENINTPFLTKETQNQRMKPSQEDISHDKNKQDKIEEVNHTTKPIFTEIFKNKFINYVNGIKNILNKNKVYEGGSNDSISSSTSINHSNTVLNLNKNTNAINTNIGKDISKDTIKCLKPQEELRTINSNKICSLLMQVISRELREAGVESYEITPINDKTVGIKLKEAQAFLEVANFMVKKHGINNVELQPTHLNNLFKQYINTNKKTQLKDALLNELGRYFTKEQSRVNTNNLNGLVDKSVFKENIQQAPAPRMREISPKQNQYSIQRF